jgi:iron complex transport system substrate-binding protein
MQRHVITTFFLVLFACAGILVLITPCIAEPVVKDIPKRIISLSPGITEALYLLGAGESVIGVTTYCQKPPDAANKEKIGTLLEINTEKVINLKPDLVIGTGLTSSKDMRKLKNLGINIIIFDISKEFDRLCNIFLELGKLVGKEKRAGIMVAESKKRVVKIQKKVEVLPRKKVFVQLGSKPLFASTKDYFINDLIEFAGGINIFKEAKSGLISREEVVRRNPDIVIITTMGMAGGKEQKSWQQYKTINAVKNKHIYLVDSDRICSLTPVSFADLLEDIVKILHPEVFKG